MCNEAFIQTYQKRLSSSPASSTAEQMEWEETGEDETCNSHSEGECNHKLTALPRLNTFPHITGDTQTPGALVATARSFLPTMFLLCNEKIS